jgi:hypothetical protein
MILHCGDYDLEVLETDNSYRYRAIRGDNSLTLYFSMPGFTEVPVGAYCEYQGETYTLKSEENFKKNGTRNFEYTLVLQTEQADLGKWKVRHPVTGKLKFSFMGTPQEHLSLLVENLNMRDSGWSAGDCIEATQKLLSYNHDFCSDALNMLADEFETEWEFQGKTIHLRKAEYYKDDPLPLSYGKGNGFLPGVGRTNYADARRVEVLYVQGGERNIDVSKYGSAELLLPKNQTLVYEGRTYKTDAYGFSIQRADVELVTGNEDSLDCSHIYPMRNGTVSAVNVVDAERHLYDVVDSGIPSDLDFESCLIAGETMTVMFQTGILAGKEFEAKYIHAERRFELAPFDFEGQTYPNASWSPAVGDTYAVYGIMLPDAYVSDDATQTGASWDMFREGARYLYEHEEQPFTFTGELDGIWSEQNWLNVGGKLVLGGYVSFTDGQFQQDPVLIRIVGIKDFVRRPYSPVLELSNRAVSGTVVGQLQKIEANEVVVEDARREAVLYTRRSWRDAVEALTVMQEAGLAGLSANFTEAISPLAIQSMMAVFGDESLQFRFVSGMSNPQAVSWRALFDSGDKTLTAPAGVIQHLTLGINDAAPSHGDNEYRFWSLGLFTSPPLEDAKRYYLYAKVGRTGTAGSFYLSETAVGMDSDSGYYYLWVGFLNSAFEGERADFVPVYGFTEILPGQITTERLRDSLGRLVIDLANAKISARDGAEISGKITFSSGTSGYGNIADRPDLSAYDEALNYLDNVLPDTLSRLQNQIDDAIESYFYHYDPTLLNVPASEWTTVELREAHLDDTFTNLDSGQSWRFTKDSGDVYGWTLMADSAATRALVLAGQAKDTADNKRRVFYTAPPSLPAPPYDAGDLWVQGAGGDIMRCSTARQSGAGVAGDWVKASKYTDDTAALAAIDTAVAGLNSYLDGAFSDGLVSEAEAAGIRGYLNVLAAEKANVDAGYTSLYGNGLLTGSAKTNLYNAHSLLDAAYGNLVYTINSAISDGKVSAAEKTDVDDYYLDYKNKLSTYSTRNEEAHAAVVSAGVSSGTDAAKEDMAKRLGYADYAALVSAATAGKTVIDGNYIRTALIDAEAIVTEALVTKWITAAYIAAMEITTGKLTVTDGANIGNFNISGGWLECNSQNNGADGFINMKSTDTRVAFGRNLTDGASMAGGVPAMTARIVNDNSDADGMVGVDVIALDLRAKGNEDSIPNRAVALRVDGGVRIKGSLSVVEKVYSAKGAPFDANNASILKYYNTFILAPDIDMGIVLPNRATVENLFGSFSDGAGVGYGGMIKLTVVMAAWTGRTIQLHGDSSTPLVDNDGDAYVRNMRKGDVIQVGYFNGAWYTLNFQ